MALHENVTRVRKLIHDQESVEDMAALVSRRFQEVGLSRALSEPLSKHLGALYLESFRWLGISGRIVDAGMASEAGSMLGEMIFSTKHLRVVLGHLHGFLERAEDNLSDREEITHRESDYERELAPFSRLESTRAFRRFLNETAGLPAELAAEGAQAEADLLKVVYLEQRLRAGVPKPADLYAMVIELELDTRRHLVPSFEDGSAFLRALREAADRL